MDTERHSTWSKHFFPLNDLLQRGSTTAKMTSTELSSHDLLQNLSSDPDDQGLLDEFQSLVAIL